MLFGVVRVIEHQQVHHRRRAGHARQFGREAHRVGVDRTGPADQTHAIRPRHEHDSGQFCRVNLACWLDELCIAHISLRIATFRIFDRLDTQAF